MPASADMDVVLWAAAADVTGHALNIKGEGAYRDENNQEQKLAVDGWCDIDPRISRDGLAAALTALAAHNPVNVRLVVEGNKRTVTAVRMTFSD